MIGTKQSRLQGLFHKSMKYETGMINDSCGPG